jgi:3-oxoacyl-[acyl-carrier protein] reductase
VFVKAGAQVAFNYQNAKTKAEALAKEMGGHCVALASDLSNSENSRILVEEVVKRFGRLDILVVNHGVWPAEDISIDRMPEAQWRNTLAVNLESVFGLIKYSVVQMKKRNSKSGHIVLVSSTSGQRGEAFHIDYSASKGALISMTKGLSTELARDHIYVNCVAPGWVDTDMVQPALADPKTRDWIVGAIPVGRVGSPEEIAMPILFLCTPYAGFITGEIFNVNGGAVLTG